MSHRAIVGLRWAREMEGRPSCIPVSRPRGAKRAGLVYEDYIADRVARSFGAKVRQGVWFEFWDANGPGYCQTDVMLTLADRIVIFECKYTWVPQGRQQIDELYRPVVSAALGMPVQGVVVCKVLTPFAPHPVGNLPEALASGESLWHCLSLEAPKRRGRKRAA